MAASKFTFYLSCDVDTQVKLRVCGLHGQLPGDDAHAPPDAQHGAPDVPQPTAVYAVAQLVAGGEAQGLSARTRYAQSTPAGACRWGEWLTFPLKYRDLPYDTWLAVTVWELTPDGAARVVGATSMHLFNKKGRLKTGAQRLTLWRGRLPAAGGWGCAPAGCTGHGGGAEAAAGNAGAAAAATAAAAAVASGAQRAAAEGAVAAEGGGAPSRVCDLTGKAPLPRRGRLGELDHVAALYARGDLARVPWLDALALREVRRMRAADLASARDRPSLTLSLLLPSFPHAVLYLAPGPAVVGGGGGDAAGARAGAGAAAGAGVRGGSAAAGGRRDAVLAPGDVGFGDDLVDQIYDTEVGRDNPAELKAQKLARSLTRGAIDRDLKPTGEERRRIAAVLKLPPNRLLAPEERSLLWRFRFSLVPERRALTKFLKAVDWGDAAEAAQAVDLMRQWAPIGVADALELLSPDFKNEEVRVHAVRALQAQSDEQLLHYLLQLVQALRYEASDLSMLSRFLTARGAANPVFATHLHWYLFCEWEDPVFGPRASSVHGAFVSALTCARGGEVVWEAIRRQTDMMTQLAYMVKELKSSRLKAARATERLRAMLAETGPCGELATLRVPLPLNPAILTEGLVPEECSCFKSAQLPVRLTYRVAPEAVDWGAATPLSPPRRTEAVAAAAAAADGDGDGEAGAGAEEEAAAAAPVLAQRTALVVEGGVLRCVVIYKKGDDLRQDQFILQMIRLMDSLLKRQALDLRLTPYRVMPTSGDDGLVEFVPSAPLSKLLSEHRTIHRYLAQTQADPSGPFGLRPEALESFVRSCAGYCVMTYILGVGDRHLDNLMLAPDGRLFHIDFGYILGSDPKPFPPPMKLCREMIEAMGGQESPYYAQFRSFCCEAYNILRASSDLILSLFHLMAGARIEAIRASPENAMLKLQEKLRLDLDDEGAVEWMQGLIADSATALMPQIVEATHRWAQYWR